MIIARSSTPFHQICDAAALDQITAFLGAIYEPDEWVELRPLPSSNDRSWYLARDVEAIVRECLKLNRNGENVYFGANPRKGRGRAGADGVSHANSIFVDFDDKHLKATTLPEQIAEVRERIAKAGLAQPSILVGSGHGVHAWWLFVFPTADLDEWEYVLDGMVTLLGSCHGAKGRERIMRVPGMVNWKEPVARSVLVECNPQRRYEWVGLADEIRKSMPPLPPMAENVEKVVASRAGRPFLGGDRLSVIDEFNRQIDVATVLEAAGYRIVGKHFRRPGKTDRGFSGIIRADKHGRLVSAHWSSNDELNDHQFGGGTCGVHDSFDSYALLKHGGDIKEAVKAAAVLLNIELPKNKDDLTVLQEIGDSIDSAEFCDYLFANHFTDRERLGMTRILAKYTTNPHQVERILAMPAGERI